MKENDLRLLKELGIIPNNTLSIEEMEEMSDSWIDYCVSGRWMEDMIYLNTLGLYDRATLVTC